MAYVLRLYRFLNLLSLDVVSGAVVCAIFFSRLFNVAIRSQGLTALGLTVWIIYTADHLLDAKKLKREASTERHRFHQNNFAILSSLLVIAVVIDVSQLAFIRTSVLVWGSALALIIGAYFLAQRYLKYLKELFAAVLYTGGVLLIPLSLKGELLTTVNTFMMLQFFITALINLLLFSWFDGERDEKDSRQSFVTFFGAKKTRSVLNILFIINTSIFLTLLVLVDASFFPVLLPAIMNLILFMIMVRKNYFMVNDRYRLLGDAVFMIPIFYLINACV